MTRHHASGTVVTSLWFSRPPQMCYGFQNSHRDKYEFHEVNWKCLETFHYTCLRGMILLNWLSLGRTQWEMKLYMKEQDDMLEITVSKRWLRRSDHARRMNNCREAKQSLQWIPTRRQTWVDQPRDLKRERHCRL